MTLPIMQTRRRDLRDQYHADDIPKPMDVEICPRCNSSACKGHEHKHPEGEE